MLLRPTGKFQLQCDFCGAYSDIYQTMEALITGTNFGNSLWEDDPGWICARPPMQVVADDAALCDEYPFVRGPVDSATHICPGCRGLTNSYYA